MYQKVYHSEKTSFVFISSNTKDSCDKRAKVYFNNKNITDYISINADIVKINDELHKRQKLKKIKNTAL